MAEKVGGIYYDVTLETGQMVEGQRKVDKSLNSIGDSADKLQTKLSAVGAAIAAMFAAGAIVGQLAKASEGAKQFEKAIDNLSAITGATGKDLEYLTKTAKEFGATTSASALQAVEAMKLIASAKPELLENAAALKSVTEQAVILADASGMTLPQAADSLTLALNQMGAGADQAGRFINVMAAGAKFGASEIAQSSEALKQFAVSAKGVGLSIEEANAGIQALAAVGVKGGEAGTALRNVLLKLETETNKKLKPSINGLAGALENLGKKNLDTASLTKMFGLENINAVNALIGSTDQVRLLTAQLTGTDTALEQAKTNTDNYAGSIKRMENALENAYIEIGTKFNPALKEGADFITNLAVEVSNGSDRIDTAMSVIATAAVVAAGSLSGPLVIGLYSSVRAMAAATTAATVFSGVMSVLGGPVGIAITALGLLALNWDKVAGSAKTATQISEESASKIARAQGQSSEKAAKDLRSQLDDSRKNLADVEEKIADSSKGSIYGGTVGSSKEIADLKSRRDAYVSSISDINAAMSGLGGKGGRGSVNPELVTPTNAKPATTGDNEKTLAAKAYYESLVAENKFALEKIDAEEKKALFENQKRLVEDKDNAGIYAKAKIEIVKKFSRDRALLEEKTTQEVADLNIALTTDEVAKIELVRTESIRRADAAEKIGVQTHGEAERAKTLATFTATQQRAAISERITQTIAETNIAATTDELTKIDLARQESIRRADAAVKSGAITFAQGEADKARASVEAQNAIKEQVMSINPIAKLTQEYEQKLSIVRYYEQQMVQAGVDAAMFAEGKRAELATQFKAQRQAMAESEFAMQSQGNKSVIDSLNSLASTATSSISGLITGTMSAQDAMKGLANVVLNSAVGALVEVGVQYIKNAIIGQTTAAAVATAQTAAIATTTTAQIAATAAVTTTSVAAAGTVAAAAAPAAGLMSIATLGQAALIGGAAIIGTMAIAKSFGGGRQYGGPVSAGSMYRVNETGAPEMFTASSGKQYMMPSKSGQVTAADKIGGGGEVQWNVIVNNAPQGTTSSVDQSTRTVTVAVAEVASQIRNNSGPVWSALRGSTTTQSRL